jgi:peptide-methionine (R)-S-oxide reductase
MFGAKLPEFNMQASGTYVCARCRHALFAAHQQFDAGCGFPSFWWHLEGGITQKPLHTYGRSRIQLLCSHCGQHLGHLFPNKHTPTGLRYCISKTSIQLEEQANKKEPMTENEDHFNNLKAFIREHRSNESNFDTVYQKMETEQGQAASQQGDAAYAASLQEIMEKQAAEYRSAKEAGGTAWPEYEKLITAWERAIAAASENNS